MKTVAQIKEQLKNQPDYIRIAILGNIASGKTTLALALQKELSLAVDHVDSIQFDQSLKIKPLPMIREAVLKIQKKPQWIIDGYGPLDLLEERIRLSSLVVFLDPSLAVIIGRLTLRFFTSILSPREELPPGSQELQWAHIKKAYRTAWGMHKKMRPEMIKLIGKPEFKDKVIWIWR